MATDPPADLTLAPINGEARSIADWVTTFQLAYGGGAWGLEAGAVTAATLLVVIFLLFHARPASSRRRAR